MRGTRDARSSRMHPIARLHELGQSVWLDYLDHGFIVSGELERMIREDGIAGATSNPTIFQKSIASSAAYDPLIRSTSGQSTTDARVFEDIEVQTVTLACDAFRRVYDDTNGADGFVSIEVSPGIASDTNASIDEAHRLWSRVDRPNVMVKIPGTKAGIPAIEACLSDGININVTLLFSVERYLEVVDAFLRALEHRATEGLPINRIASVASFFVSRVDTKVDQLIDRFIAGDGFDGERAMEQRGQAAIANARLAFDAYRRILSPSAPRWSNLAAQGARPQRVLWASTSTKDPTYPDLYYADALIGPGTIDTMTLETVRAFAAHGSPKVSLTAGMAAAREHMRTLAAIGVDIGRVTAELEEEGVRAFAASYDKALASIAQKKRALPAERLQTSTHAR
jgi:transaldolase